MSLRVPRVAGAVSALVAGLLLTPLLAVAATTFTSSSITTTGTLQADGNAAFDTSTLFVDSANSRVGIGTTGPGYLLHINSGAPGSSSQLRITAGGAGSLSLFNYSADNVGFALDADLNNGTWVARDTSVATFQKISDQFRIYGKSGLTVGGNPSLADSDVKLLVDLTNGNVGIGTTSPGVLLEVNKNQNTETGLYVLNPNTGDAAVSTILVGAAASGGTYGYLTYVGSGYADAGNYLKARRTVLVGSGTGGLHLAASNASGAMSFTTGGTSDTNERMRITSAGNVGIGTTGPNQKFEIGGNGGLGFSGSSPALNSTDKKLYSPADGDLEWYTNDGATGHGFAVSNAGTKAVYLNTQGNSYLNGGKVGIGDTTPASLLTVGNGDKFQVDTNGNLIKIDNVTYDWPDSNSAGVLTNGGSGTLTWAAAGGGMSVGGTVTSGTVGSMLFVGSGPVLAQDNANVFWDDTNNRLGIGTATPGEKLEVVGNIISKGTAWTSRASAANNQWFSVPYRHRPLVAASFDRPRPAPPGPRAPAPRTPPGPPSPAATACSWPCPVAAAATS